MVVVTRSVVVRTGTCLPLELYPHALNTSKENTTEIRKMEFLNVDGKVGMEGLIL